MLSLAMLLQRLKPNMTALKGLAMTSTQQNKRKGALQSMQGALFDCDGTLLDSLGVWRGLEDVLSREANVTMTPELRAHFVRLTVGEIASYVHEQFRFGTCAQDVQDLIDEYMLDFYRTKVTLLPGVGDFLEECARASVRMSVVSSSTPSYLQAGLKHAGILSYFDAVVSVDDVGASKREPTVFNHARNILGTPIEYTWGFEDSLYALDTLRQAGYPTVGLFDDSEGITFEQLKERATVAVHSFAELSLEA